MPSLLTHVFRPFLHELVASAFLACLRLMGPFLVKLLLDSLTLKISGTDRAIFTNTEKMTAPSVLIRTPERTLIGDVQLCDRTCRPVRVYEQSWQHVLELLLLEHGNHENPSVIGPNH